MEGTHELRLEMLGQRIQGRVSHGVPVLKFLVLLDRLDSSQLYDPNICGGCSKACQHRVMMREADRRMLAYEA